MQTIWLVTYQTPTFSLDQYSNTAPGKKLQCRYKAVVWQLPKPHLYEGLEKNIPVSG
jgi:hypothetical protein